jgi:hypothetical protein
MLGILVGELVLSGPVMVWEAMYTLGGSVPHELRKSLLWMD